MITTARIVSSDGDRLTIIPKDPIARELDRMEVDTVEIRLRDGREISPEQRRAIFATVNDISIWSGHEPEYIRAHLMWEHCLQTEQEPFSLSDCSVTQAHDFLDYLIDFVLRHGVPLKEPLALRTDDIGRYMYHCIEHGKCAVCGQPGEIHHVDTVGANGGNRKTIIHAGLLAVCLCRIHHTEAHMHEKEFFEANHIEPIRLDNYLCRIHNLRYTRR
jgi:hypothetical protein